MRKDIKGQISVEMLAVVGVVIVGSLIFATYYLSSVNRNIDQATDIDVNFGDFLPTGDGAGGIEGIDPGNGGPDPHSCEGFGVPWDNCNQGDTINCSELPFGNYIDGIASCNNNFPLCTWNITNCDGGGVDSCEGFGPPWNNCNQGDTINCSELPFGDYTSGMAFCNNNHPDCDWDVTLCSSDPIIGALDLLVYFNEPRISLTENDATVGQNRSITAELEVPGGNADFSVNVRNEFNILTNVCQIGSDIIPATEDGWDIGSYSGNQTLTRNISCSDVGTYEFNFKLDDGTNEENETLTLTVTEAEPPSETVFSLCGKDSDVTFCINHLNNEQNPVNGVKFYVNFPDYAEHKEESPACYGNNCFYLGISS